jgi:hypothetical protein
MSELCLLQKPAVETECLCFDQKHCDIHVNDGGYLVCRHGSNEGVVDGIARVICPLEIDSERKKWEAFLDQERNQSARKRKT